MDGLHGPEDRPARWEAVREDLERGLKIALALLALSLLLTYGVSTRVDMSERVAAAPAVEAEVAAAPALLETPETPRPLPPLLVPRQPGSAEVTAAEEKAVEGEPKPDEEAKFRLLPRPMAIDSASFLVDRGKIKLSNVLPVSPSRECERGGGTWPCGMMARTALRSFLRARSIRCEVPPTFGRSDETVEAECSVGGGDIGLWLLQNGWARATDAGPLTQAEDDARAARRGIWGDGGQ